MGRARLLALGLAALTAGCAATAPPVGPRPGLVEVGEASWYGSPFHGRPTASGEPFDMFALTAAHRALPFGTRCRVTNQRNGRSVVVRVNDRMPRTKGRVIDLSYAAANALNMVRAGHVPVAIEVLR
jgi:rare lipoprotein A